MKNRTKWIWVAILLPLAVDYALDRAIERQEVPLAMELLEAGVGPDAEVGPGHGAYCERPGGQALVFFERDLPQLTTYAQFEQWCAFQNGETKWSS